MSASATGVENRPRQTFRMLAAAAAGLALSMFASAAPAATVLLNDSFADGDRTDTALPSESAVIAGASTSDGGSLTTVPGAIQNVMGTGSRKVWTYFTSDASAPDGNQPHNGVTSLAVGEGLKTSIGFTLPNGATSATTGKDFRFGVFFDPTDARVLIDTNNDSGGGTAPWGDATGYAMQIPLNATSSGTNPITLGKRTSSANTGLLSSNTSYTNAAGGGGAYALAEDVNYTAELELTVVSPTQLDVTARVLQGATVLTSHTVSDLGATFGGVAVTGTLPGNNAIYTNFDQLFWRMASNVQASQIDITNFSAQIVPEPASIAGVLTIGLVALARRRKPA